MLPCFILVFHVRHGVGAVGEGKTPAHEIAADVHRTGVADRNQPAIEISGVALTSDGLAPDQVLHGVGRFPAAGPAVATVLVAFGRVDPEEADAFVADHKSVAIHHRRLPGKGPGTGWRQHEDEGGGACPPGP